MSQHTRREFLTDVGRGMLVAGLGYSAAVDFGFVTARADDGPDLLSFGPMEPLVCLMQETPVNRLIPVLIDRLKNGADLRQLVSAAALANARTFGGDDYIGFHTLMALAPAYKMAGEMSAGCEALPVLKVLYRNTNRIQEHGGRASEVLHPVRPATLPEDRPADEVLRDAVRRQDLQQAEQTFATLAQGSPDEAFNHLLVAVQEATEVHRVVLPYRAWVLLDLVGKEHAHTMLRQSLRYCVNNERHNDGQARGLLAKLFDQYHLEASPLGTRQADDAWVDQMSQAFFQYNPEQAADAAAAALADGMAPDSVCAAIALAANQLVLRDAGRPAKYASSNKPVGSVHGDSIGVHACDAVNAWRNIARASNPRNAVAAVILSAYEVARDRTAPGLQADFLAWKPRPYAEELQKVTASDPETLLREADGAIREKDQARACAVVESYGRLGHPARAIFDLLLRYATSEDGALHAEKYYHTVSAEFAASSPPFRWRQLVALARVTASEYGQPAPGYAEACRLLGV